MSLHLLNVLQLARQWIGILVRWAPSQFSPTLVEANVLQRYALHLHRFNISDRFIKRGNKFRVWTARAPNRTANDEVI